MSLVVLRDIGINTLVLASMYILASLGFAFIFNMLGTINLAHGALYMISAYLCYYFCTNFGINNWLAMLITAVVLAAFGILLERFVFRVFLSDFSRVVMVGVALITIMETGVTILTGTSTQRTPSFAPGVTHLGSMDIGTEKLVTFIIGLFLLLVILYIDSRTALGRQMKAIAQDYLGAALQGIPIQRVAATACAIGCALVAVSGSLMGAYQKLSPYMGDNMMLRILMVVMLAGAGSTNGLIITGLIMGLLDSFVPVVTTGAISDAIVVIVVVILLLIRPQGFFGHEA